jgi:hypothetical protein
VGPGGFDPPSAPQALGDEHDRQDRDHRTAIVAGVMDCTQRHASRDRNRDPDGRLVAVEAGAALADLACAGYR